MTYPNANPSVNPANLGGMVGMLKAILKKSFQQVDGVFPASVISYDRTTNRAKVQPQIMVLSTAGSRIPRASIASVPVFQIGGGDFLLNFNLNPGDLGWIIANDRDISLFLNNYAQSPPNTERIKDFADSFFIPDCMRGYVIDGEDAMNTVLQNKSGTVKISLGADKIKIAAPNIEIDGDEVILAAENTLNVSTTNATIVAPTITITSTVGVNITTPLLHVEGNISASGTITPGS